MADVQSMNVAFSIGVMHFTVKSATDALPGRPGWRGRGGESCLLQKAATGATMDARSQNERNVHFIPGANGGFPEGTYFIREPWFPRQSARSPP